MARHMPLEEEMINILNDQVIWDALFKNTKTQWSENLLNSLKLKFSSVKVISIKDLTTNKRFLENFYNSEAQISEDIVLSHLHSWRWGKLIESHPQVPWLKSLYLKFLVDQKKLDLYDFLTEGLIDENLESINWKNLSRRNKLGDSIQWSSRLLSKYENYWVWSILWQNESIPWNNLILKKYLSRGKLEDIIQNRRTAWQEEDILENLKGIGDFSIRGRRNWLLLSKNTGIEWNEKLLLRFEDLWYWKTLSENESLKFSPELILRFLGKWDWDLLSGNKAITFDYFLLENFKNNWNWQILSRNSDLPWSTELIIAFHDKWDWNSLSENTALKWSNDLLKCFEDSWNWCKLSSNRGIRINPTLIKDFEEKWDFSVLSKNQGVIWSEDLLIQLHEKLNFKEISKNLNFNFSAKVLIQFKSKLDWSVLSRRGDLPWTVQLLEQIEDTVFWSYISGNGGLPWSVFLIERYAEKLNWNQLVICEFHDVPVDINFIEKYIHNLIKPKLSGVSFENSFSTAMHKIFSDACDSYLVPLSFGLGISNLYSDSNKEIARQYLKIFKVLNKDEWEEVTLINVDDNNRRSIDRGDRNYHYVMLEFSGTTRENLDIAYEFYNNKRYKEVIAILGSYKIEIGEELVNNMFIGQRFMIKGNCKAGVNFHHPLDIYPKQKYQNLNCRSFTQP